MSSTSAAAERKLSDAEKARIERNRQRALHLKQAKLIAHPYSKNNTNTSSVTESIIKVHGTKYVDSGGGFLIEESATKPINGNGEIPEEEEVIIAGPTHPIQYEECLICQDKFIESYLFTNFAYSVCDSCRDPDDKHSLITKTEAKSEYLLQDCDLDKREPPLKFIMKKNPHNVHWGDMKLYLHLQIEKRALEVWGSEDNLRKQHELREDKREKSKVKKYNKKMKELRMDMRSSLYDKTTKAGHQHTFGPDQYNEEDDNYTHTCTTCSYSETFEKM